VNECLVTPALCSQACDNTDGGYKCSCRAGYELDGLRTCRDINECQKNTSLCSHMCTNTDGNYTCSCTTGYELDGLYRCRDIDECALGQSNCTEKCVNTAGSFHCSCDDGKIILDQSCAPKLKIIRFRLKLRMDWNNDLLNYLSPFYRDFRRVLEVQLTKIFVSLSITWKTHAVNFRKGSVIFDAAAETPDDVTNADYTAASGVLLKYLDSSDYYLQNASGTPVKVDGQPVLLLSENTEVTLTTVCSAYDALNQCKNGSKCVHPDNEPMCQCAEGFSGEFCDVYTKPDSGKRNTGLIIGLSVTLSLLALVVVALLLYCCCIRKQSKADAYRHHRYNYEETASEHSADGGSYNGGGGGSMKSRLTPRWTSDYTTSMYRYYDNPATKPPQQNN